MPGADGSTPEPPTWTGRVRVTSPLADAPRHDRRSARQEIDEATAIGEVYVQSLIRSQLRSALAVAAVLVLTLGLLPVVFLTVERSTTAQLLGLPLPWLLLAVAAYPFLCAVGWWYLRRAERAERDFVGLVDGDGEP